MIGRNIAGADIFKVKDPYVRRARLQPALIVSLPIGLAILAWSQDGLTLWAPLWGLLAWAGATSLLAQVARDSGKRKEPILFESWGGKPTTTLLRYAGSSNSVLVTARHQGLQTAFPDLAIPTEQDELANSKVSDDIYDVCVRRLLERTRNAKHFPLVFEENCNYGFRRNLWGMRSWAICVASVSALASAPALKFVSYTRLTLPLAVGSLGCIACLLLFWLFVCDSAWVKIAADAFAERLLASVDAINKAGTVPTPRKPKPERVTTAKRRQSREIDAGPGPDTPNRKRTGQ
jgi:hypothetical protein